MISPYLESILEIFATLIVFSLCMAGLGIGAIASKSGLIKSCGSDPLIDGKGQVFSCGACPKKEATVCPTDNPLAALAQIAYPSKDLHK